MPLPHGQLHGPARALSAGPGMRENEAATLVSQRVVV